LEEPSNDSIFSYLKKTFSASFRKSNQTKELPEEINLLINVEDYFTKTIREVMVPRTDMITLDKTQDIKDAIALIHEASHTRIPVEDGNPDNIVGILYAIDLFGFFGETQNIPPISTIMRKPFFASYSQQIHQLLSNFKKNRTHMAIVIDEHGGVDGLITVEDVIEELVGDIPDEFDKDNEPAFIRLNKSQISIDANFPLAQFNDEFQTDFQKEGIETIGGYVCHIAGKIPEKGETLTLGEMTFTIDESNERKLEKLVFSEARPTE
jgi:CBS domain containing-hemolysin-like protein